MFKIFRVPEKLFSVVMWIVSLVFAGFLMGLGQLVIGDLPLASKPVEITQFMDPTALANVRAAGQPSTRPKNTPTTRSLAASSSIMA